MNPMVKMLLSSLEKDEHGIPTTKGLTGLMDKIDTGVKDDKWPKGKRVALMKRISNAAATAKARIEGEA
jgi:hypothetical protein